MIYGFLWIKLLGRLIGANIVTVTYDLSHSRVAICHNMLLMSAKWKPPITRDYDFFSKNQKLGFVSFLIILFSVIVQKIHKIVRAVLITQDLHFVGPIIIIALLVTLCNAVCSSAMECKSTNMVLARQNLKIIFLLKYLICSLFVQSFCLC